MAQQTITPWTVEAAADDNKMTTIDYDHVIEQFGCQKITPDLTGQFNDLVGNKTHRFLTRNLAFAHRDFDRVLECVKKNEKFFLYTGRGPSSESMHIGHGIPFLFCKYLQDTFHVPLVIQITDDEKFLCKEMPFEKVLECADSNIRDIIAFGLDPELTYIFSNYEASHLFASNTLKVSKSISLNEAMKVFGFNVSTNIGMVDFPAKQIAAGFASSYSFLKKNMQCLIPCAIDQDPYFRLARDKCKALEEAKPATIYLSLLPNLQGTNKKMSASDRRGTIYLCDSPAEIKNKINKYAFSGGQETVEEHRVQGGDTEVDVAYQYMRYFLEDEEELQRLKKGYESGSVLSGEMKQKCIEVVQEFVRNYQEKRKGVTDKDVAYFKDPKKLNGFLAGLSLNK